MRIERDRRHKTNWLTFRPLHMKVISEASSTAKGMDAGTIDKIGVDLTPQDVAEQILKLVKAKGTILTTTHTPVGFKTKILYQISSISPQIVNRLTNLLISKK